MTYLITFTCYGARLHGDEAGSVDPHHNLPGSPVLAPDPLRVWHDRCDMTQEPYRLDPPRQVVVLGTLREVCDYRGWRLLAAHVRCNHVHVILDAPEPPEKVMNALKAYASRKLNRAGLDAPHRRRWSRHGSTRYLWNRAQVEQAIAYVADRQGEPMALYVDESR